MQSKGLSYPQVHVLGRPFRMILGAIQSTTPPRTNSFLPHDNLILKVGPISK